MVNLSFEQGVCPDELKIAVITPLYKAKDPMFFNNYRPISLLSVFSKIFERLMYNRILNFINRHKLFNKFQFGFRNNHLTFMALIILIENLVNALDNGKCAVGIFLDFQKAFDTVNHSILLDKLHCYGIRGIANQWFLSYLSNRQQSVVYNGYESELKVINCGVPQGSILGPLLFLLYINDLTNVSSFLMPILFADDTNLFCTGTDLKEIIRLVNEEISKIYDWVNANKLPLNIDKTNFMLFTPKNFSHCIDDIVINQIKIQEVKETKFLGVIIDNKLKWSAHIMYISKKIAKGIGILLKSRKVFDNDTLLSLYHTFVYPYLHYCINIIIQTAQLAHSYITMFFFLTRFFIAGCTGICYLTNSSVAGGGCFTGMMAFPFFFPFGVHVQFMETFYVCVYIKSISLHKVIYTKLVICYKAEVYSKEQNLHHFFS